MSALLLEPYGCWIISYKLKENNYILLFNFKSFVCYLNRKHGNNLYYIRNFYLLRNNNKKYHDEIILHLKTFLKRLQFTSYKETVLIILQCPNC